MGENNQNTGWIDFMAMVEQIMLEKYGAIVMEHIKNPRNKKRMQDFNGYAKNEGQCGDTIEIWVKVLDDAVERISFQSNGCEITQAVASMATELTKGKNIIEALKVNPPMVIDGLGGLPEDHVHCAYLAMGAIHDAIGDFQKKQ